MKIKRKETYTVFVRRYMDYLESEVSKGREFGDKFMIELLRCALCHGLQLQYCKNMQDMSDADIIACSNFLLEGIVLNPLTEKEKQALLQASIVMWDHVIERVKTKRVLRRKEEAYYE